MDEDKVVFAAGLALRYDGVSHEYLFSTPELGLEWIKKIRPHCENGVDVTPDTPIVHEFDPTPPGNACFFVNRVKVFDELPTPNWEK